MEQKSTIIVLGIILLVVLPFIIYNWFKKIKEMRFKKTFLTLSEKGKVIISQKEMWLGCYAFGIDYNSNRILYLKKRKDQEVSTIIDLSEVEKCKIVNTDRTQKNLYGNLTPTNRLDLVFTFRNSSRPEEALEFYNNPVFMPSVEDFSQIGNWLNIINEQFKKDKN